MGLTQITRDNQIKPGNAYRIVANDVNGTMSENAAITGNRAVASDVNGQLVASTTTDTELGYVSGVTSPIQTQLNALIYGLSWKQPALLASVVDIPGSDNAGTITISNGNATYFPNAGATAVIDGVTISVSNRILVKSQTLDKQNGIYTVTVAGVQGSVDAVLVRSSDMNTWAEVPAAAIIVEEGTINSDLAFVSTADPGGTLNTTSIPFVLLASISGGVTSIKKLSGSAETGAITLAGTTNEVVITDSPAGTFTFSLPQAIATTSTPTFARETLSANKNQLTLGTTNTTVISSTAPSAGRTYTIPDAGSSTANFVLDKGSYTIGGTWSFSNNVTVPAVLANNGSVIAPSYTFTSDSMTGMFYDNSNTFLDFTVGGTV